MQMRMCHVQFNSRGALPRCRTFRIQPIRMNVVDDLEYLHFSCIANKSEKRCNSRTGNECDSACFITIKISNLHMAGHWAVSASKLIVLNCWNRNLSVTIKSNILVQVAGGNMKSRARADRFYLLQRFQMLMASYACTPRKGRWHFLRTSHFLFFQVTRTRRSKIWLTKKKRKEATFAFCDRGTSLHTQKKYGVYIFDPARSPKIYSVGLTVNG